MYDVKKKKEFKALNLVPDPTDLAVLVHKHRPITKRHILIFFLKPVDKPNWQHFKQCQLA